MSEKSDTFKVGIDLGTSRSAISAPGARHMVDSYVGWPLDMVARKVLKRDVLIGRDALENRPMLDLHRPLERGLIKEGSDKDEQAVRELLRHLVSLVAKDNEARRVRAVVGVPAEAMRISKQNLRKALDGIVGGLLLVSEPFAVAYGMDALLHALVIDLGAGTTDLCVMNGRYPTDEDQRTLPNAGDAIDEQLFAMLRERHPEASFTIHMVRGWKEAHSFVGDAKEKTKVDVPVNGRPSKIDITEPIKLSCESIVAPVVEALFDLVSRVDPEFQAKVRQNVILSGGTALIRGLGPAIESAMKEIGGGKVTVVSDPTYAGSDGGLALAQDAADADWERVGS